MIPKRTAPMKTYTGKINVRFISSDFSTNELEDDFKKYDIFESVGFCGFGK